MSTSLSPSPHLLALLTVVPSASPHVLLWLSAAWRRIMLLNENVKWNDLVAAWVAVMAAWRQTRVSSSRAARREFFSSCSTPASLQMCTPQHCIRLTGKMCAYVQFSPGNTEKLKAALRCCSRRKTVVLCDLSVLHFSPFWDIAWYIRNYKSPLPLMKHRAVCLRTVRL